MKARLIAIALFGFSLQACAQGKPPAAAAAPAPANASAPVARAGGDAAIRTALGKVAPGVNISGIKPSPLAGMMEVMVDGRVLYVSSDGKYLLQGALIDLGSRTNLTEASEAVARQAVLAAVPDTQKISFAPANPKYRVTVFTDIDCSFCRKMHSQISEYNRLGIAVDYLFFPRAGIGSESFQKAVNVWCAPDRKVALTMAKAGTNLPKKSCKNFVSADYNLGNKVGVSGTPAIYAGNGVTVGGYLSPADLLKALQKQVND